MAAQPALSKHERQYKQVSNTDEGTEVELSLDEALGCVGTGSFQHLSLLVAGLTFAGNAVEVTLSTFLSPCLQATWNLSGMQIATLSSCVFAGAMVGSMVLGSAADVFGRKPIYFTSCGLIFLFGIASSITWDYTSLLFTRIMVGFGLGGMTAPFNLLAELLQPHERGKYLLYIEYFWTIGCFYATLVAYVVLSDMGWRVLSLLCSIPIFVSLLAGLWTPESPQWLLVNGRANEAKDVVIRIGKTNQTLDQLPFNWKLINVAPSSSMDVSDTNEAINKEHSSSSSSSSPLLQLFSTPFLRNRTMLIWIVWFCYGVGYYGLLTLISEMFGDHAPTTAATTIGISPDPSSSSIASPVVSSEPVCGFHSLSILFSSSSELVGLTLVIFTIDSSLGRRGSQAGFLIIASISCLLLGVLKDANMLSICSLVARGASLASSSATWVAIPELYPTKLRSTGHSIANIMARIGAFVSPYVVSSSLSNQEVAILFGLLLLVSSIAVCLLPETMGIKLDDAGINPNNDDEVKNKGMKGTSLLEMEDVRKKKGTAIELSSLNTSRTQEGYQAV